MSEITGRSPLTDRPILRPIAYEHHRYNGISKREFARRAGIRPMDVDALMRKGWFQRSDPTPEVLTVAAAGVTGGRVSFLPSAVDRFVGDAARLRLEDGREQRARDRYLGVYIVRTQEGPLRYKIGFASNVLKRMSGLQGMSPVRLKLVAFLPGKTTKTESELHHIFAESRLHGEWFGETKALLTFCERHRWTGEIL